MDILTRLDACAECEQAPLAPLLTDAAAEIRKLRKDAERYRTARCMTPHQWSAAWELNEATGKPFDEIIDNMRPFVGGR